MIVGFAGHLVCESVLARHLDLEPRRIPNEGHGLGECRRLSTAFGPASSLRSIFEGFAVPFARALGFDAVSDVAAGRDAIHATLSGASALVALMVVPGASRSILAGARPSSAARHRKADWALVFNGSHVRLLAATAYARRFSSSRWMPPRGRGGVACVVVVASSAALTVRRVRSSAMDQLIAASVGTPTSAGGPRTASLRRPRTC
jgi:hypothetical protein